MNDYCYTPPLIHGTLKRTYASQLGVISGLCGYYWHLQNHLAIRSSLTRLNKHAAHLDYVSPDIEGGLPFVETLPYDLTNYDPFFIKSFLSKILYDGFISLKIDEFFVPQLTHYNDFHFFHRLLLCKELDDKFLATTYYHGVFRPVEISHADFMSGFSEKYSMVYVHLLKQGQEMVDFFRIKEILSDYLSSFSISSKLEFYYAGTSLDEFNKYGAQYKNEVFSYGRQAYLDFFSLLDSLSASEILNLDISYFSRFIKDRGKILSMLANQLQKSKIPINSSCMINPLQIATATLNKVLYYCVKNNFLHAYDIFRTSLEKYSQAEEKAIEHLYKSLDTVL